MNTPTQVPSKPPKTVQKSTPRTALMYRDLL